MSDKFAECTDVTFARWAGTGLHQGTGLPLVQFDTRLGRVTLVMSCDDVDRVCATLADYSSRERLRQASGATGKAASSERTLPDGL